MKNRMGFTLSEVLVVIGIFAIIATLAVISFSGLNDREALEKDASGLVSFIRDARMLAVSSKNAALFGVHLEAGRAVLFEGDSYIPGGAGQKFLELSPKTYISAFSLNEGGSDIVFSRLTGVTSDFGTVKISLKDDTASTTITVLPTGVVQ